VSGEINVAQPADQGENNLTGTSRLVAGLTTVCREHLLREKWLLAPTLRVGHQWLDCVTRSGQPVVNAHVKTLRSMALDLAAPELLTANQRLLTGSAGPLLVDRVFRDLQEKGLAYLGSLRPSAGLAELIHRSVQALRIAGVTLEHVPVSYTHLTLPTTPYV
jgi:hypothetical protein